ncbi:MAG: PAS domain S-box protein, partial [Anaerolineales bacterium]|nr:PAS domain S-box protein [Anaerolineales bacterium]
MMLFLRTAGPAAGIVLAAGLAWAAWTPAISGWAGWLAAAAAALALAVAVGRQRQSARQVAGLNAELSALRGLLQDCPLPAARLSAQGEVLDANPAGRALVPVLAAVCGPAAAQVQQSGRREVLEVDVAGRIHTALFTPAEAGANVYLSDVTASRQIVADLQRERDFAQQVMATMGQGLVILDAQNRFEYVNPAAVELLGRSARDLAGRTLFDVMRPDDFPHLSEAFSRQRAGQPYTYEAGLRRPDGSLI